MRFTKGNCDMGQFITQQALKRGGRLAATNDLPPIRGEWRYSEDQYGVVLHSSRESFPEVQTFLRKAFGAPAHEPSQTTDGGQLGWYAAKTTGVVVQFGFDRDCTQVIVLRPQQASEIMKRLPEALEKSKE
jgi:hypothetical protein